MLNQTSKLTRPVDLSDVYAARKRGLEALQQSIRITTNPFLIANADGIPMFKSERKTSHQRPRRRKPASLKIK